jgi:hypothetical protein
MPLREESGEVSASRCAKAVSNNNDVRKWEWRVCW